MSIDILRKTYEKRTELVYKIVYKQGIGFIQQHRESRNSWGTLTTEKEELATAIVDTLSESIFDAIEPEAKSQAEELNEKIEQAKELR